MTTNALMEFTFPQNFTICLNFQDGIVYLTVTNPHVAVFIKEIIAF